MTSFTIVATALSAAPMQAVTEIDQGLTLVKLISNIPHDLSALVVYAMLVGSGLFVWRAGKSGSPAKETLMMREAGQEPDVPPR